VQAVSHKFFQGAVRAKGFRNAREKVLYVFAGGEPVFKIVVRKPRISHQKIAWVRPKGSQYFFNAFQYLRYTPVSQARSDKPDDLPIRWLVVIVHKLQRVGMNQLPPVIYEVKSLEKSFHE